MEGYVNTIAELDTLELQEVARPFAEVQRTLRAGGTLTAVQRDDFKKAASRVLPLLKEIERPWEAAGLVAWLDAGLADAVDRLFGTPVPERDIVWARNAGLDDLQVEMLFDWTRAKCTKKNKPDLFRDFRFSVLRPLQDNLQWVVDGYFDGPYDPADAIGLVGGGLGAAAGIGYAAWDGLPGAMTAGWGWAASVVLGVVGAVASTLAAADAADVGGGGCTCGCSAGGGCSCG